MRKMWLEEEPLLLSVIMNKHIVLVAAPMTGFVPVSGLSVYVFLEVRAKNIPNNVLVVSCMSLAVNDAFPYQRVEHIMHLCTSMCVNGLVRGPPSQTAKSS